MKVKDSKNIIYGLIDPFNGELRYIGKSTSGLQRPRDHFKTNNLKAKSHKVNWVNKCISLGSKPEIITIESYELASDLEESEIFFIEYYKSIGCNLTNSTKGGEGSLGHKNTPESIEKMRIAALNRDKRSYQNPHNKKYIFVNGIESKPCSRCKNIKPLCDFNIRGENKKGVQSNCKECNVLIMREFKIANPSPVLSDEEFNKTRIAGGKVGGPARALQLKNNPDELAKLKAKMSKAIIGTELNTGKVIEFSSALEAKANGFQNSNIGQAIKLNKPYRGYIWKFKAA